MSTKYTPNLICPYCGHEATDSWRINMDKGLEWDDEIQCMSCEKRFWVSRHCQITLLYKND